MEQLNQSSSPREIFARNLRLMRHFKDMSQEQLALESDLSRTYVSEVERASRNISIDNMGRLANSLGVSLKDLLDPEMFSTPQRQR